MELGVIVVWRLNNGKLLPQYKVWTQNDDGSVTVSFEKADIRHVAKTCDKCMQEIEHYKRTGRVRGGYFDREEWLATRNRLMARGN